MFNWSRDCNDKLHFISWTQIQKSSLLWLKFTSLRVNSKKWPNYMTWVICGLSIFFFRKVNNSIVKKFAILSIENVLNFQKINCMKKCVFHSMVSSERPSRVNPWRTAWSPWGKQQLLSYDRAAWMKGRNWSLKYKRRWLICFSTYWM